MRGYKEAIDYLYGLQYRGIKLGMENTRNLLELLGNPHGSFRSIHVAGTNGKGSTSALIASVLQQAGFRVGLFTSPHLVSFTERIQIDGEKISEGKVVELTDHIRSLYAEADDAVSGFSPTFFEFVTVLAFSYFRERGVEWAVVETGMGGRLDSTNILLPDVTVITRIGVDHKEFLGSTLTEIAREKAGIIKNGIPLVTVPQHHEAERIIYSASKEKNAPVFRFGTDFTARIAEEGMTGSTFDYVSKLGVKKGLSVPLPGRFQVENSSVAIKAVELLNDKKIIVDVMAKGLAAVKLEGRCELVRRDMAILFDGAHNPDAALSLAKAIKELFAKKFRNFIFIIGMMGDKDTGEFISRLAPLAKKLVFTTLSFERAAKAERLGETARDMGYESITVGDMKSAFASAKDIYTEGDLVVVTGSFYAVGEAKGVAGGDTSLYGLTEFK